MVFPISIAFNCKLFVATSMRPVGINLSIAFSHKIFIVSTFEIDYIFINEINTSVRAWGLQDLWGPGRQKE